jgi:hypothetical protein
VFTREVDFVHSKKMKKYQFEDVSPFTTVGQSVLMYGCPYLKQVMGRQDKHLVPKKMLKVLGSY